VYPSAPLSPDFHGSFKGGGNSSSTLVDFAGQIERDRLPYGE
jgi:hypothetical protein